MRSELNKPAVRTSSKLPQVLNSSLTRTSASRSPGAIFGSSRTWGESIEWRRKTDAVSRLPQTQCLGSHRKTSYGIANRKRPPQPKRIKEMTHIKTLLFATAAIFAASSLSIAACVPQRINTTLAFVRGQPDLGGRPLWKLTEGSEVIDAGSTSSTQG